MSGHSHAPSTKSLYLILVSTFFFGFLVGAIVFLQNNTGGEGDGALNVNTNGFEILAYTYGGCEQLGCASYRVIQNGSYTFTAHRKGEENSKFEGTLESNTLATLKKSITEANFEQLKGVKFTGVCPSLSGGIAFRYDITYKGNRVSFDSCAENLSSAPFFELLLTFFPKFQEAEQVSNIK